MKQRKTKGEWKYERDMGGRYGETKRNREMGDTRACERREL